MLPDTQILAYEINFNRMWSDQTLYKLWMEQDNMEKFELPIILFSTFSIPYPYINHFIYQH